jgi:hypothetical protein
MSITVTFGGAIYQVPEEGDVPYSYLTDYLVALSSAGTTDSFKQGVRIASVTPQSMQAGDSILICNYSTAGQVNLPLSPAGTIYGVYDGSGSAYTNNITVSPTAGTIEGSANYVISTNYGGCLFQFNGTNWIRLSEVNAKVLLNKVVVNNSATNPSVQSGATTAALSLPTLNNFQSCTFTTTGNSLIEINISSSTTQSVKLIATVLKAEISAVSDLSEIFLQSDSGTGVYVTKSAFSGVISVKNRLGNGVSIKIQLPNTEISSVTAWS